MNLDPVALDESDVTWDGSEVQAEEEARDEQADA